MASLFEITGEFLTLYELATQAEDEQAFLDTLEGLTGELEEKASGYVGVIQQMEMEAERCDKMVQIWQHKKTVRENATKRLKEAMRDAMIKIGMDEVKAGEYTIKLQNNGGKKPLVLDGDVPDNMTKITVEPDKEKIRKFLEGQEGEKCAWAHLEERGKHIKIK